MSDNYAEIDPIDIQGILERRRKSDEFSISLI